MTLKPTIQWRTTRFRLPRRHTDSTTFTPTVTRKRAAWLKEAEKKHGRVALLSAPTLLAIRSITGDDPGLWLNAQTADVQGVFYAAVGFIEYQNLKRLDKGFTLKHGEIPGKLISKANPSASQEALEDLAGRIAMLATVAILLSPSMIIIGLLEP